VITRHNLDILTPLPARSPGGHPWRTTAG